MRTRIAKNHMAGGIGGAGVAFKITTRQKKTRRNQIDVRRPLGSSAPVYLAGVMAAGKAAASHCLDIVDGPISIRR